jgi:hypothetical protein
MRNRINFLELEFKCSVINRVDPGQGEVQTPENVAIPQRFRIALLRASTISLEFLIDAISKFGCSDREIWKSD